MLTCPFACACLCLCDFGGPDWCCCLGVVAGAGVGVAIVGVGVGGRVADVGIVVLCVGCGPLDDRLFVFGWWCVVLL